MTESIHSFQIENAIHTALQSKDKQRCFASERADRLSSNRSSIPTDDMRMFPLHSNTTDVLLRKLATRWSRSLLLRGSRNPTTNYELYWSLKLRDELSFPEKKMLKQPFSMPFLTSAASVWVTLPLTWEILRKKSRQETPPYQGLMSFWTF